MTAISIANVTSTVIGSATVKPKFCPELPGECFGESSVLSSTEKKVIRKLNVLIACEAKANIQASFTLSSQIYKDKKYFTVPPNLWLPCRKDQNSKTSENNKYQTPDYQLFKTRSAFLKQETDASFPLNASNTHHLPPLFLSHFHLKLCFFKFWIQQSP